MIRFGLLGPLEVVDTDGRPIEVGGRQPRTMLAVLLAASGRTVSVDTLATAVWGDTPPASATGTLQSYVSRLRRRFGDDAPLTWDDAGYRLDVPAEAVDFRRFELLADKGRDLAGTGDMAGAAATLTEALALWRGAVPADLADREAFLGFATRLDERRLVALEDRIAADLELGRHGAIVGELTELVAEYPLRERFQEQLALALYRSGRQADALRALDAARRTLRDELGIEPSRPLRELEAAILAHDPGLDRAAPQRPAAAPAPAPVAFVPTTLGPPAGLVGREDELAELTAAYTQSHTEARFVVVEGEPGIGKTRLVDELRAYADARGSLAIWGRADEGGAAPALWPWLAPLRAIADRVPEVPPSLVDLLRGSSPMSAGQAGVLTFERFDAVAGMLTEAGRQQPVVVLLDDLQWADDTSLELLEFLAGRLQAGVLVVGTMRQLEVGRNDAVTSALAAIARRPGSRRLTLRGLSVDATARMLEAAGGRHVAANVAATIHQRAEGNPFYALELSRLVDEEGDLGDEVPGGVGDVIRRRLRRLPEATIELLGTGAVVGRDIDVPLLARAAERPLDEALDTLEPAVVHRLLVEVPAAPATLRFSHALVREVLLEDLTSLRRARLHLKVADAIEAAGAGIDEAEILAEHLWQAAPVGVSHRAADALERAAEVALHRVAYGAAEESLVKAARLRRASSTSTDDQAAELRTIMRLLEVARSRRYFQGAKDLDVLDRGRELAQRLGRTDLQLTLLWFEWSALATSVQRDRADPLADVYASLTIDDPRPEVRAGAHEVYGVLMWEAGRIGDACARLETARQLMLEAPVPSDPFELERALVTETFWIWNHAEAGLISADEAFSRFDDMLSRAPDRFGTASICGFAATAAITLGRWDHTERYVAIEMEADPGSQFAFWGGQALMQRAVIEAMRGGAELALDLYREGRDRYVGIGAHSGMPTFSASVALHLAECGRLEDAETLLAEARAELTTRREMWNEPIVLIAEAVTAHAAGDLAPAEKLLRRAVEVCEDQGAHAVTERARAVARELALEI